MEALGHIASAAEIAALRVDDINDNHTPFAPRGWTRSSGTATATNAILTSCEMLDNVAGQLAGEPAATPDATTHYEACSFQDITGQRITKVVATLKTIEAMVSRIVATFGDRPEGTEAVVLSEPADVSLLSGPQHPTVAMDQSDIDKLMASFE